MVCVTESLYCLLHQAVEGYSSTLFAPESRKIICGIRYVILFTAFLSITKQKQNGISMNQTDHHNSSPALLKALELILASPAVIKQKVKKTKEKFRLRSKTMNEDALKEKVADKLITSYSTKAGLSGGATALIGVVPGLGTALELFGGATADMALCLKYQVEMSMALADLYGQDIESEADRKRYFIIAGLSTLNMETLKQGSEQAGKLFTKLLERYLREATFDTVRILFRKLSITLSKKMLQKAIPFGIGAVIGFSSNKTLTWLVGRRAKEYFASASMA